MAVTPLKVLLFLAGASGAAGGTAYFAGALDPYIQPVALVTAPDGAATAPAAGDGQAADKPAAATTGEEAAKTERVKPAEPAAAKPAPNAAQPTSDGQAEQVAAAPVEPAKPAPQVAAPAPVPPSFDLLRVEPDGSIVIAGRAMPGSSVEVLSGSKALAQVDAGPSGDFVAILDEPLKPGDYQIVLRSTGPATVALTSVETAVVSVPSTPDGQVLALVEQPGAPSKLITAPPPRPVPEKPAEPAVAAAKPAAEPAKPAAPAASQDQAAASPPAAPEPAPAPQAAPVSKDGVAVEAVEIEGRKIFVAGAAPLGATVRIYANELLLGDAKTSPEGRFLLEAERDLKVGDYIIRADVLSKDGSKVLARAAVPFEREPGDSVAAVAEGAARPNNSPANPPKPAVPAATSDAPAIAPSGAASTQAGAATPTPTGQAETPPSASTSAPATSTQAASPAASSTGQPTEAAAAPAAPKPAEGPGTAKPAEAPTAVALAPKLQPVGSGVIIRRGNSLWRISKRVYGLGTRYSTIYVANKEQIRDPDKIWPGQIFLVPDKSDKGEAADMKAIGEQAITVE